MRITDKQRLDWLFKCDVWKHSHSDSGFVKSDWSHKLTDRKQIDAYIRAARKVKP